MFGLKTVYRSCILLFSLLFFYLTGKAEGITIIPEVHQYFFNDSSWSFFTTANKNLPVDNVEQFFRSGRFRFVQSPVLNGGIPSKYYWFHFAITNADTTEQEMIVDIQSPRLNELELFESGDTGLVSKGKLGDFFPFEQRQSLHKNFQYTIKLGAGETKDYFLYVNQIGQTFYLPVVLYKAKAFQRFVNWNYMIDGVTYGILLFVGIFGLLFYINTRYALYLQYCLYILSAIAWFLAYFGVGYQFLWPDTPALCTIMAPFLSSINLIINIQISHTLLKTRLHQYLLFRIGKAFQVMLACVALFPFFTDLNKHDYTFDHTYMILFLSVIVGSIIVVFISIMASVLKGSPIGRYYFIASILKVVSIFNLALLELGFTPGLYHLEGMLQFGILVEITFLTYALARRYTTFKIKTYQKIVQAQEEERDNISKEIHDSISGTLTAVRYSLLRLLKSDNVHNSPLKEEVERIRDHVSIAQTEARNISHNLMPAYIKEQTIDRAIEIYISDIQQKIEGKKETSGVLHIQFQSNREEAHFPEEVKLNIFRIIQELLSNMLKHSGATAASITLDYTKKELVIIAEDNGVGIDSKQDGKTGMGLKNIESRVKILNGSLQIASLTERKKTTIPTTLPDGFAGTSILIRIPLREHRLRNAQYYEF